MSLERLDPDEALALRFDAPELAEELAAWCAGQVDRGDGTVPPLVWVPSNHEPHAARVGDWIVRMPDGSFAPMDPVEFAAHYRPAPAA